MANSVRDLEHAAQFQFVRARKPSKLHRAQPRDYHQHAITLCLLNPIASQTLLLRSAPAESTTKTAQSFSINSRTYPSQHSTIGVESPGRPPWGTHAR